MWVWSMGVVLGDGLSCCRDYQEVKVQEQVQKLEVGKVSSSLCTVSVRCMYDDTM